MNTEHLQEGDIIFISIKHYLYRQVAKGTGSKASHVGIVLKDDQGRWQVAESAVPVAKYSSLERFIARSQEGWHCIRRLKSGISDDALRSIKAACDVRMGTLYHLGFKYHSKRLFCSKLVYDVFESALGVKIGTLESLRALHERMPHLPLGFWRLWYLGSIPWSRLTITPASQMHSELLETVYES